MKYYENYHNEGERVEVDVGEPNKFRFPIFSVIIIIKTTFCWLSTADNDNDFLLKHLTEKKNSVTRVLLVNREGRQR